MAAGGRQVDLPAVGVITLGSLFLFAAIKGKSVLSTVQTVIRGGSPQAATAANPILATPGGGPGAGGSSLLSVSPGGELPGGVAGGLPGGTSASERAWVTSLLAAIGAPPTAANIDSVSAWIAHESSWDNSPPDGALYTNNPLNTTQPGFGATGDVNSVGVKIYPTQADGLAATVFVMNNGSYDDILAALRSGRGLIGSFQGLSTWSGGGYSSV